MAASSLLVLIDDIASVLDDVSVMTKVAAKKTAGVLGDDLALNAEQVSGVRAERELPVVWAVAKGSLRNKAILVPAALAISAFVPWLITPLLVCGGLYLCFEGVEKIAHRIQHGTGHDPQERKETLETLAQPGADRVAREKKKIRGAIRTDFILSGEITVIALGIVAGKPLATQFGVLAAIGLLMTVGVYGLVAGIVKMDDVGLHWIESPRAALRSIGRGLVALAPRLMRWLGVIGTIAMFMVGGGILSHGIGPLHDLFHHAIEAVAHVDRVGTALENIVPVLLDVLAGLVAGTILWGLLQLRPRKSVGTHLAVLLLLAGCGNGRDPGAPDVIVICLDTLRADRVGVYGRAPSITPELDAFAATATVYERAWATSPWTLPSHASMFTGQYPFEHGAHSVPLTAIGNGVADATNNVVPLTDAAFTLAERFHVAGYRTGAIVANEGYVTPRYGLDQGFEHFDVEMRDIPDIVRAVDAWLAAEDGRPNFLFVNTMDTHRPYNLTPREGFVQPESPREGVELLTELAGPVLTRSGPVPALDRLAALYDLAVANLDEGIGDLLDVLRAHERFDDAVVVILSDHGESFGEHDLIEHGKDLYEHQLRVPFLVKAAGQTTTRVETAETSLVHLPSLLAAHVDALGVEAYPYAWPSDSVIAENHYARMIVMRRPWGERFQRVRRMIVDWPHKMIESSDGQDEAYDLAADPAESANLAAESTAAIDSLRALLHDHLDNPRATFEKLNASALPELTPEEIEKLRSLGYF